MHWKQLLKGEKIEEEDVSTIKEKATTAGRKKSTSTTAIINKEYDINERIKKIMEKYTGEKRPKDSEGFEVFEQESTWKDAKSI